MGLFKAYVVTNAATLTDAELSAIKAHLEPVSTAYTISSDRETTLVGVIARLAITPLTIDTSAVNLNTITVGGTTSAPLINLNGFITPTNTALRFRVGLSS